MKQTQVNPWDQVAGKYPPGTMVEGTVRNLTNYGAFIEIEEGIDGLLHISDMSWTRKIGHPNEILEKGQRISCQVLNVDQERKRIALGLKQLKDDPWETDIPSRYEPGDVVKGKVTKLTNFGVFVELEPGLEGLLHISELADHKVDSPEEVVKVGDEIEVKILRVDRGERKIGLSRKKAQWTKPRGREREEAAPPPSEPTADGSKESKELKGGLGGGGPLFSMGGTRTARRGEAAEEPVIPRTVSPTLGHVSLNPRLPALRRLQPAVTRPARVESPGCFFLDSCRCTTSHDPCFPTRSLSPSNPHNPRDLPHPSSSQISQYVLDFQNHLKLSRTWSDTS